MYHIQNNIQDECTIHVAIKLIWWYLIFQLRMHAASSSGSNVLQAWLMVEVWMACTEQKSIQTRVVG